MKKSARLLGICVLYCFAVSVCLILTLRLLYVHRPYGTVSGESSGSLKGAPSDSSRAMGPANTVPWYRITLGLQKAGLQNANDSLCIFRDIPLHYLSHRHFHSTGLKWKNPWRFNSGRALSFHFSADTPHPDQWTDWKQQIRILLIQTHDQSEKRDSATYYRDDHAIMRAAYPSLDGITRYWICESATAEWAGYGWATQIQVPLAACDGDSSKARGLADRMCDRVLRYYATWN